MKIGDKEKDRTLNIMETTYFKMEITLPQIHIDIVSLSILPQNLL